MRSILASALLLTLACASPPGDTVQDAGVTGADAGQTATPLPAPLLRLGDGKDGLPRTVPIKGLVTAHGPATDPPSGINAVPARHLDITDSGNPQAVFYYTLPVPFRLLVFPNDQVRLTYKESVGTTGAPHSYGVLLRQFSPPNALIMLAEDGALGPAFTKEERLGFDFELDTQVQAIQREMTDCGEKAHYPGFVSQGGRSVHLYPGESTTYTVDGADLTLTLLDLYRYESSFCGPASDYSVAYIVQPKG